MLFLFPRCEKKKTFENPVASFLALKWRNWEISDVHSSLEGVIKQCKGKVECE